MARKTKKQFFKEWVKKIFNVCGFEIRRRTTWRTNLAEVLDHISKFGLRPKTVIDIGVAYGTFELYEKFPNARHFLVEPLKEWESVLKEISRDFKAEYVIAAAGAKPGTITINVHSDLSSSSIFKETEGDYVDGVPREVAVVTIDDLCHERNLIGPYLIKIDAQGAEIEVLEGAKKVVEDTEVIILEVHLFQFFVNGPQFYDIVNYLKDHKFVVYDIFGNNYRPLDKALASVDMVFVKEKGLFRKSSFYATQSQRKQLTKPLSPEIVK